MHPFFLLFFSKGSKESVKIGMGSLAFSMSFDTACVFLFCLPILFFSFGPLFDCFSGQVAFWVKLLFASSAISFLFLFLDLACLLFCFLVSDWERPFRAMPFYLPSSF